MKKILGVVILSLISLRGIASADLTKQDIEEIRKVVKEEIHYVNIRIDDTNRRIDDTKTLLQVLIGGIFVFFGFVLWDRRIALDPAIRKTKELEKKEEKIEKVLKEYAFREPKMAEVLKLAGLM